MNTVKQIQKCESGISKVEVDLKYQKLACNEANPCMWSRTDAGLTASNIVESNFVVRKWTRWPNDLQISIQHH